MAKSAEEIANAMMALLYRFVSMASGDLDEDPSDDPFVAWCKPGIPFAPEDFRFAQFILKGQGATLAEKQADAALQHSQAAGFSRFADFVPTVTGVEEGKITEGVLRPGSATLSGAYKRVIESTQVAALQEPEDTNERIQQLTAQAEPMREAYEKHKLAYDNAFKEYIAAKVKTTYDPLADLAFASEGAFLRSKAESADEAWEISGYKTQYQNLVAEIASLRARRSPAIWRQEVLQSYKNGSIGESAAFGDARLTMPYPGSFATNVDGWTDFSFTTEHVDSLSTQKSSKWGASGGFGWGSLKLGGGAEGSSTETLTINNTDNFSIRMRVAQVPLLRGWFDPWFLRSQYWRFNPATELGHSGAVVSDGASPPSGLLSAYPIAAIFVRNVEITMAELRDENSELVKTLKAEGKGGWGFGVLNVGGSYERNSAEKKVLHDLSQGKLTVPGMQLVGVNCELVGQAPHPKQGLTWIGG
ncbi:hypothetical protein ABIF70_005209 [Bradyrhizobium japonicum]